MQKNQIIKEILKRWRGFPNTSAAGCYEFLSQTVEATSLEYKDLLS